MTFLFYEELRPGKVAQGTSQLNGRGGLKLEAWHFSYWTSWPTRAQIISTKLGPENPASYRW